MYHRNNKFFRIVAGFVCLVASVFPVATLYAKEITGRAVEEFSGTLKNGLPAEHRIIVGTEGKMSLVLSFVGGNSTILLEVFDRDNKKVYSKRTFMAGQFIIYDLSIGNYLLRLTPIQKVPKDLSYQLQVLLPTATYIEEEPAETELETEHKTELETFADSKLFPFSAYVMIVLMIIWGVLAFYLYRFLRT